MQMTSLCYEVTSNKLFYWGAMVDYAVILGTVKVLILFLILYLQICIVFSYFFTIWANYAQIRQHL